MTSLLYSLFNFRQDTMELTGSKSKNYELTNDHYGYWFKFSDQLSNSGWIEKERYEIRFKTKKHPWYNNLDSHVDITVTGWNHIYWYMYQVTNLMTNVNYIRVNKCTITGFSAGYNLIIQLSRITSLPKVAVWLIRLQIFLIVYCLRIRNCRIYNLHFYKWHKIVQVPIYLCLY